MRLAALLLAGCSLAACVKPGDAELEAPAPSPEAVRVSDDAYVAPDLAEGGIVFRTGNRHLTAEAGADVAEAPSPAAPDAAPPLGKITVTLGPPAEAGLWASSKLVDTVRTVHLADPKAGVRIEVELRPTKGVEQMSLDAYRALGLSPAEIVTLEVHAL